MKTLAAVLFVAASLVIIPRGRAGSQSPASAPESGNLFARHYQAGDKLSYHMTATNQDRLKTMHYQARANAIVKQNASGQFYEEYQWSSLEWNGKNVPVPADFRQLLSLDPNFKAPFPDIQHAGSGLVGPVLDLMTFYVDLGLAVRLGGLAHPGDHVYMKHGGPNSWAAGEGLILGEDAIDFDLTLKSIDQQSKTMTLLVQHVPPQNPQIHLPAEWMHTPVADTANNWVEVGKNASGEYRASVGKETFDDVIVISLADGRILSASMDNPVQVLERQCSDAELTACGKPIRYEIRRKIEITSIN